MRELEPLSSPSLALLERQRASVALMTEDSLARTYQGFGSRDYAPASSTAWDAATNALILSLMRNDDETARLGSVEPFCTMYCQWN